jgi:hypothetical protein
MRRNVMTRLRLLIIAALVLAISSCQLIKQENMISFTLDGLQYLYAASADHSDHPYAVGYETSGEVVRYEIKGSATAAEAAVDESTIVITLAHTRTIWAVQVVLYDGSGIGTLFNVPDVDEDAIDSFLANRDAVGDQLAGAMPGPFSDGQMTHTLTDIVFSVERLPNEPYIQPK